LILWFGSPDVLKEFRNSGVIPSYASTSIGSEVSMQLELRYYLISPEIHGSD